jgi:hypothetical protein
MAVPRVAHDRATKRVSAPVCCDPLKGSAVGKRTFPVARPAPWWSLRAATTHAAEWRRSDLRRRDARVVHRARCPVARGTLGRGRR